MPKTRINCPNCRQPLVADVDQLVDVGADPAEKQRFLSGAFNFIQCQNCGYQGTVSTPLVYHDPEKELLLTFVPPEIGLPRDDQERLLGSLINQVVNRLPQEKRKAYLLRPQSTLTLQGLLERVLEADGITREMIQAQQQRLSLIQRLLTVPEEQRAEIARQEDQLIDLEFFNLLRRITEASLMSGDQQSAQQLSVLQESLLPVTTFGRELQARSQEMEMAVADLQKLGRGLNRDNLLDLLIQSNSDTRLRALVSLTRPVMDYSFFQLLSEKIERAKGEEKTKLTGLREKLLELTQRLDQQVEARAKESRQLLDALLKADDITQATIQNLPAMDDFFFQELEIAMEAARKEGNLEKISRLQKVVDIIQQASAPPPEVQLIEDLLEADDEKTRQKFLEEHSDQVTQEFIDAITNVLAQVEGGQDRELADRVRAAHRSTLKFSMQRNIR